MLLLAEQSDVVLDNVACTRVYMPILSINIAKIIIKCHEPSFANEYETR